MLLARVLEHSVCKVEIVFKVKILVLALIQEHTVFTEGLFLNTRTKRWPTVTYVALRRTDRLPRSKHTTITRHLEHLRLS